MKKIIAVINQKGGVGKSTTTEAIGAALARQGHRVLFVDMDAQGNLSYTLDAEHTGLTSNSVMDVLTGGCTAREAIQHTPQGDIIASAPSLAGADTVLTAVGKEYRLREALEPLLEDYDYIVIDTPPALGILTVNALTACTGCIIPAQADIYSLQGISQLYGTLQTIQKYTNPGLQVMGILLTRYSGRSVISRDVAEMIEQTAEKLNTRLYQARIRECTALKEAQAMKKDIFTYAPRSNASADYTALVAEMLKEE